MYPFTSPNGQSASSYYTPNPPVYGSPTYQTPAYNPSGSHAYQSIPSQTPYSVNHGYLNQAAPSIPNPSAANYHQSQTVPYMAPQNASYLPQQPAPYVPPANYGSQNNPATDIPPGYTNPAETYLPPGNHGYQNHTQPSSANTLSFSFSFQSNTPSAAPTYQSQASHGHNGNLAYTNQAAINSPSVNPGYQYQATPTSDNPGYPQQTAPYGPSGNFGHQSQAHYAPADNHSHQISQLYSHLTSPSYETQRTPYTPASNVPRQAQTISSITSPDFFHQNQTPYASSGNLANRSQAVISPSSDLGYETMLSPESGLSNRSQISSPTSSSESRNLITIPISPPEKLTEYLLKFNQAALLQTKPQQPKEAKAYKEVKSHSIMRASATIAMERKIHRKPVELPTSAIHYKFKATNENQLIRFNGQCLSVAELKTKIIEKIHNSTKDINFDLQILHEQNETPYKDEDLIQRNMSVTVVRVPKPKTRRGPKTWNQAVKEFVVPVMNNNNNRAQSTVKKELTDSMYYTNEIYKLDVSEEDKIKVMMFQSAQDFAEDYTSREPEEVAPAFNHYDRRSHRYRPYSRPYANHNPYKWVAPDRRN